MTITLESLAACATAVGALAMLAAPAAAQSASSLADYPQQRVDKRQQHQSERITHGVEQGQITGREQLHLERQQRQLNHLERRIESDGRVSAREAVRMERAQDHASHNIYRARHNPRGR
ncbi:MAG TPA: hypothetical protein PLO41_23710 [Rubrivivax sp.]|nr:hypothetical protein [Rubrivivax sp.]